MVLLQDTKPALKGARKEQKFLLIPLFGILAFFAAAITVCGCDKKTPASVVAASNRLYDHTQVPQKKVLVIQSYNLEYEWTRSINRGIDLVLGHRADIQVQYFYMDTKRRTDAAWKQQVTREVMELVQIWQPDVIIAADDNAQDLIGRKVAQQGKIPLVFCGVNQNPSIYGYPTDNITGVLERLHFTEGLEFFKTIRPDAQKIVFVSDNSPTSKGVIEYCKNILPGQSLGIEVVDWVMPATFSEWQQTILHYKDNVDAFAIYTYHTVKPDDGSTMSVDPKEVMHWTVQNCDVPIIGFLIFSADDGAFCGVFESGIKQGQFAADKAVSILNGIAPKNLPITTPSHGRSAINTEIARRLGISIPDSILQTTDLIIDEVTEMGH